MPAEETFVSFRLRGTFDPAMVTERLGIAPSDSFAAGAFVGNGRSGRRHDFAGWFLESRVVTSNETEEHLSWILDQLEPCWERLAGIRTSAMETDVECFWKSVGSGGGPWIPAEAMARLGALGLPLLISFYYSQGRTD